MNPDFKVLKSEILALHRRGIDTHLNKNVDFFIRDISENYLSVSNGEIHKPTLEEIKTQFTNYLNNTIFTEYKDLCEPIIGFSNDGSIAWYIVQVKGEHSIDDGSERELDFICAWITLFKQLDDKWIRLGDVSTFK